MSDYTNKLSAEELIAEIAMDPPEESPEKIKEQRDDFIRICKDWLEYNDMVLHRRIEESEEEEEQIMAKNTFNVPYMFNPGILTGRLPNHLLKKIKKAVNSPEARSQKKMTRDLVGSIREEYVTPEIPGFREYIEEMYSAWVDLYKTQDVPFKIDPIWTNYMKKGEFNPNHNHPGALAVFVVWVTIPYNIQDEVSFDNWDNQMYPPKNSCFEFTYTTLDGRIVNSPIYVDKTYEGMVSMFPSTMIHCVYPFRSSDEERISIAGNIYPELE